MRCQSIKHKSCRDEQHGETAFIENSAATLTAPMVQRCINCASLSAPMVQPTHRSCNVKMWLGSCARRHLSFTNATFSVKTPHFSLQAAT
jgi:hypothetical protein